MALGQGSAGHPQAAFQLFALPDQLPADLSVEGLAVEGDTALGIRGGFLQQFEPEVANASLQELGNGLSGGLRTGIEQGIAATQISAQGMLCAAAVPQENLMLLTGTAAVGVVVPSERKAQNRQCSI